jgi:hypothetical protein
MKFGPPLDSQISCRHDVIITTAIKQCQEKKAAIHFLQQLSVACNKLLPAHYVNYAPIALNMSTHYSFVLVCRTEDRH